jgi:hypothetical protein
MALQLVRPSPHGLRKLGKMSKRRKVIDDKEHIKLLQNMMLRILHWPLPENETVASYSLPGWLAEASAVAIKGIIADEEYLETPK